MEADFVVFLLYSGKPSSIPSKVLHYISVHHIGKPSSISSKVLHYITGCMVSLIFMRICGMAWRYIWHAYFGACCVRSGVWINLNVNTWHVGLGGWVSGFGVWGSGTLCHVVLIVCDQKVQRTIQPMPRAGLQKKGANRPLKAYQASAKPSVWVGGHHVLSALSPPEGLLAACPPCALCRPLQGFSWGFWLAVKVQKNMECGEHAKTKVPQDR